MGRACPCPTAAQRRVTEMAKLEFAAIAAKSGLWVLLCFLFLIN